MKKNKYKITHLDREVCSHTPVLLKKETGWDAETYYVFVYRNVLYKAKARLSLRKNEPYELIECFDEWGRDVTDASLRVKFMEGIRWYEADQKVEERRKGFGY